MTSAVNERRPLLDHDVSTESDVSSVSDAIPQGRDVSRANVKNLAICFTILALVQLVGNLFDINQAQFVYARLLDDTLTGLDGEGLTADQHRPSPCTRNRSDPHQKRVELAQAQAAQFHTHLLLAQAVPGVLTLLPLGAYSDHVGRRFLFVLDLLGFLCMSVVCTLVSYFVLDLRWMILGYGVQGFCGGPFIIALAANAYTADNTPATGARTLGLALSGIGSVFAMLVGLWVGGYFIQAVGFVYPFLTVTLGLLITLAFTLAFLAETNPPSRDAGLGVTSLDSDARPRVTSAPSLTRALKDAFGFYLYKPELACGPCDRHDADDADDADCATHGPQATGRPTCRQKDSRRHRRTNYGAVDTQGCGEGGVCEGGVCEGGVCEGGESCPTRGSINCAHGEVSPVFGSNTDTSVHRDDIKGSGRPRDLVIDSSVNPTSCANTSRRIPRSSLTRHTGSSSEALLASSLDNTMATGQSTSQTPSREAADAMSSVPSSAGATSSVPSSAGTASSVPSSNGARAIHSLGGSRPGGVAGPDRRVEYCVGVVTALFLAVPYLSCGSVNILYVINYPFCWLSHTLGTYMAVKGVSVFVVGLVSLKVSSLLGVREEWVGVLGFLSMGGGYLVLAFADTNWMVYVAAAAASFSGLTFIVLKSLMSQRAPPAKQGCVLATVAVLETVSVAAGGSVFNTVYSHTVSTVRGAVYLMAAAFVALALICMLVYVSIIRRSRSAIRHTELIASP